MILEYKPKSDNSFFLYWTYQSFHSSDPANSLAERKSFTRKIKKYEHVLQIPGGNPGVRFNRAYYLDTLQPLLEWTRMYEEVELEEMGLDLSR